MGVRFCNILVIGRTGAGKSSLVNYLVGAPVAKVGVGRPVTCKDDMLSYCTVFQGVPIRLFDTWGVEDDKVEDWTSRIVRLIGMTREELTDGASWFHTVVYCISASSGRIEPVDEALIKYFRDLSFSVVVALTKADIASAEDLALLESKIPQGVVFTKISSGAKTRYGLHEAFGKDALLTSIIKVSSQNLPARIRRLALFDINEWETNMMDMLAAKGVGRVFNSGIEEWIRSSASEFASRLNDKMQRFMTEEGAVLHTWTNSELVIGSQCHVSVESPKLNLRFSPVEAACAIVFAPVLVVGAIVYGIVQGKRDEQEKMRSMIVGAASQMRGYIDKLCAGMEM